MYYIGPPKNLTFLFASAVKLFEKNITASKKTEGIFYRVATSQ